MVKTGVRLRFAPRARPLAVPVALAALMLAPACRADWRFTPTVDLRETYTDNVSLLQKDQAKEQFISEVTPGFILENKSPRLDMRVNYGAHFYHYQDSDLPNTRDTEHSLRADAKAKLIKDLLFLDAWASISQQNVSAFGPQSNLGGYTDANRADVKTWHVSPYLIQRFSNFAVADVRYTYDYLDSANQGLGRSTTNGLSLGLNSGAAFRTIGWGLQLSHQEIDDTRANGSSNDNASATLRYVLSRALTLTTTVGYDKYDYESLGGRTQGKSWNVGAIWIPGARTSVTATAGRRYYGTSYSLAALHRSRRTVWSINYSDEVTTTRQQFTLPSTIDTATLLDRLFAPTIPDPVARAQAIQAYILSTGLPPSLADSVNYFSNRYILQKQFQASVAFNTARTTTVFSLFDTRRNALSSSQVDSGLLGPNNTTINDNTRQTGGSLSTNWRLTSRTGVIVSANINNTQSLSTGIDDNNRSVRLGMTHIFQPGMSGMVEIRRVKGSNLFDAAGGIQGGRDYTENAIVATLSKKF